MHRKPGPTPWFRRFRKTGIGDMDAINGARNSDPSPFTLKEKQEALWHQGFSIDLV